MEREGDVFQLMHWNTFNTVHTHSDAYTAYTTIGSESANEFISFNKFRSLITNWEGDQGNCMIF